MGVVGTIPSFIAPSSKSWLGVGRELVTGLSPVLPTNTIPLDMSSYQPEDTPKFLHDEAIRGVMAQLYNDILGVEDATFSFGGPMFLDVGGFWIDNTFGDLSTTGTSASSTTTVNTAGTIGCHLTSCWRPGPGTPRPPPCRSTRGPSRSGGAVLAAFRGDDHVRERPAAVRARDRGGGVGGRRAVHAQVGDPQHRLGAAPDHHAHGLHEPDRKRRGPRLPERLRVPARLHRQHRAVADAEGQRELVAVPAATPRRRTRPRSLSRSRTGGPRSAWAGLRTTDHRVDCRGQATTARSTGRPRTRRRLPSSPGVAWV